LHAERLQAFADQAAIALQNARLYASVQQMAMTDSLTGLYNRRALLDAGQREFEICMRLGHPLTAIMIDVDHFKEVNDTFGHPVGDQVLRALVKYLREAVRAIDIIGRYGGDEFLIFLLENDLHAAGRVAERIRRSIARALLLTDSGTISITISLGVAAIHPQTLNLASLIENADKALYAAKHSGRNRVEQWVEPVIELPEWNSAEKSTG
jgi:diguanylate cyclase (GGDEF)-like protein